MITPFVTEVPEGAVLADCRYYLDGRDPHKAYLAGHLPGAVFVDLERWLCGPASPIAGRHPFPDPETFAAGMSAAGIGDDATVVAYDDAGGVMAARLVWMLRRLGVDAALLDGGLTAYDGPLETGEVTPTPARFTPRVWPAERFADIDEVVDLDDDRQVLLDARAHARYTGEDPAGPDPAAGHIPGAHNLPVADHTDDAGRLLPEEELRARVAAAGVDEQREVISSCGSGVTACHNLLVLEHLGLPRGRLYVGSWSQWSHTDLPIATGPSPR